jgi:hypothetical protein
LLNYLEKFFVFSVCLIFIFYVRAHLTIFGFGSLIKFLRRHAKLNVFGRNKLGQTLKSIEIVSKYLPFISCLVKASALKLLHNKLIGLEVNIGIRINNQAIFESHAWVSFNKEIILNYEPDIRLYKVIYTIN